MVSASFIVIRFLSLGQIGLKLIDHKLADLRSPRVNIFPSFLWHFGVKTAVLPYFRK